MDAAVPAFPAFLERSLHGDFLLGNRDFSSTDTPRSRTLAPALSNPIKLSNETRFRPNHHRCIKLALCD